jgi:hypothetical protein
MKKEVTICFRTSEELRSAVEKAARDDHRSLSSAIELILTNYLETNHEFSHQNKERRRFVRKQVSIPAHVKSIGSQKKKLNAVILDISLSGLRVSLPKEAMPEIYEGAGTSAFETSFVLPQEEKGIRMVCRPERVVPVNGNIHVGASFIDSEFANYQQLQRYLGTAYGRP